MSKPKKVVWTKGMFLMPQHFQAQDEYVEQALHFRASVSGFANWGLSRLGVDEASLVNGLFTLRHCECIFPDGLTLQAPAIDELPAGRQIADLFPASAAAVDVYLAVPLARLAARNVSVRPATGAEGADALVRYRAEARVAVDTTLGSDEKTIQVANKLVRLLVEGENLDGFATLRIARVGRSAAGTYVLVPGFMPPLLDIVASDATMMLLRRLVEIMTAKSTALAQPRRQRSRDLADFTTSEAASFWLLHTINTYLPELRHIWQVRRGHPDVLYRVLLNLAGALTTFALHETVADLPAYDHNDLGPSLEVLDARIRRLLETVLPSKCIATPLVLSERLIWSGAIGEQHHAADTQFLLSVSTPIPVDELIAKFPRLAKISSSDEIHRLVRNSLPGISVRHLPTPPAAVPVHLGSQYFSIVQGGPLWERITQAHALSVFVPGEIVDPRMELLTVLG